MPHCADQTDSRPFGRLRAMVAARIRAAKIGAAKIGIITLIAAWAMAAAPAATSLADDGAATSAMTRPTGDGGFTPSPGEISNARQPILLADGGAPIAATPGQPSDDVGLPTNTVQPGQLPSGSLPSGTLPSETLPSGRPQADIAPPSVFPPDGSQPSSDLSVTPQQGPFASNESADGVAPHEHPMFEGLRRMFGPEPNGNWNNEPVHFDTFLGFLDDRAAQNTGVLGGFRLGWDYDTYWGVETRLGFTSLQEDTGPVVIWDESLLYYPWGDSRVRPYFTLGLGLSEFKIVDPANDLHHRENLVDMPFGVGFKYRLHEWLVLRFDVLDNVAFGSGGLGTMNNFSFTTGFEWRFGGGHYNYWPWNPSPAR